MDHQDDLHANSESDEPEREDESPQGRQPIPIWGALTNGHRSAQPPLASRPAPEAEAPAMPEDGEAERDEPRQPTGLVGVRDAFKKMPPWLRSAAEAYQRDPDSAKRPESRSVCPRCHGMGYLSQNLPVDDPNFGKIVKCGCREKDEKNQRQRELENFANLKAYKDKTFESFRPSVPGVEEAFKAAKAFAEDPTGWLILSGPVGCGKTHLAVAIANLCLQRGSLVLFSVVPELLDHLRMAFAPTNDLPYHELFDRIREVELLVMDDLGAEHSTSWASEKLYQIINYRYVLRIPTVITTNPDPFNRLDMRIQSRMSDSGLARWCHIKAQDYRPRNNAPKSGRPR